MPTSPTVYSGWKLTGDSGTSANVTAGSTVDIQGGTGITTSSNGFILDVTNDGVLSNIAGTGIGVSGATGNVTISNTGVTSAVAGSNISVSSATGAVTIAYTGGTGEMTSWTLAADSGSSQSITNGNTVTIQGSTGIDTAVSATDDVTINLDLNELTTITSAAATAELIINSSGNKKIDIDDIHLNQFGDAEADVDFGGNVLLDVAAGSNNTDGVNLGQVLGLVSGSGLFEGGYNANTGLTTDQSPNGAINGASNIATGLGDFYAVTTAGTQLGVALEIGDLIFANVAITANSSPANSDFTIVQSGQSIANAGATDAATTKGIAGFDSANFTVSSNGCLLYTSDAADE